MQELHPKTNDNHYSMALAFAKCAARLGWHTTYEQEWRAVRKVVDETMCVRLAVMKKEHFDSEGFWEAHRAEASLLVDAVKVDAVLAARGTWTSVSKEVDAICGQSGLGEAMFGWAKPLIVASNVAGILKEHLKTLASFREVGFQGHQGCGEEVSR